MPAVDVVVIGSGAAGLMAAATAAAEGATVQVVTDRGLGAANSAVAQGGLQFPAADDEAIARFRADMIRSGGESVRSERLDAFLDDVHSTIHCLISWGLTLDQGDDGEVVRRWAGGLSEPRIATAGDRIGPVLIRLLRARVSETCEVRTQTPIVALRPVDGIWELTTANDTEMRALTVVVATGGSTRQVALAAGHPTTNPPNANEGMQRLLLDLELPTTDLDRYQFQPYGILDSFDDRAVRCVPESLAHRGPRVLDVRGEPVAALEANRLELCEAMRRAVEEGRGITHESGRPGLRLTMSDLPVETLETDFADLARWLRGRDLLGRDLLVWPAMHYQLGGFLADADGGTERSGLFLAGELLGGLHGANRLMGNGITESVVSGRRAGRAAARYAAQAPSN